MAAEGNADQALVRRFVQAPARPLAVDSNPLAVQLGGRLDAWDAAARELTLRFCPGADAVQGNGVVQGGLVTAMLDFGLAFCVLALLEPPKVAVTVTLNVQFQQAVLPGDLEVRARIDRLGGRLAFASASISRAGSDEVLARATSTLAVIG